MLGVPSAHCPAKRPAAHFMVPRLWHHLAHPSDVIPAEAGIFANISHRSCGFGAIHGHGVPLPRRVRWNSAGSSGVGPAFTGSRASIISPQSAGARAICMHMLVMPPGASAKPHLHEGHETAIYQLEGSTSFRWAEPRIRGSGQRGRLRLHSGRGAPPTLQSHRQDRASIDRAHRPQRAGKRGSAGVEGIAAVGVRATASPVAGGAERRHRGGADSVGQEIRVLELYVGAGRSQERGGVTE